MTQFSSTRRRSAGLARQLALAVALASGTAVLAVPGLVGTAHAQNKKKDEAKDAAKPVYSKEFVTAYQPLDTALKTPGTDLAALKQQVQALVPLAVSDDEKQALGGLIFNTGITAKDTTLQLQGVEMMIASGKLAANDVGRFNLVGFQIASSLNQFDKARAFLQRAIDLNYSSELATIADLKMNMAELYFTEGRNAEGLDYLSATIAEYKAQGQPVDLRWYRRGVSVAYQNEIVPQVYDFVTGWVVADPKPENWRDAVNLTRNLNDFEVPALLDLMRLGRRVGTLKEQNDFIFYIEAADARRLPLEVKEVIEQAYASGTIAKGTDTFVDEQFKLANSRLVADKAELPVLERDANAPTAQLRTVMAAADVFLSYGEFAKAAAFYEKGLALPGVDRNLVLTRLGMAQIGTGNFAAARENLAKVEGARLPVARLWSAYAEQQSAAAVGG